MAIVKMYNYLSCSQNNDAFKQIERVVHNLNNSLNSYTNKSISYTIQHKYNENKIVFLISYGKSKPNMCYKASDNLYDSTILSDDVIHMTNQFIFAIYSDNKILCSNHDKRNVVLKFLRSLDNDLHFDLLSEPTSIEDFVQQLKSIDSISITATNDLFINEFLNPKWSDDLDEKEEPETTTIKMNFKRYLNENYLIRIYKKLLNKSYISKFHIDGENENGFISINEESIVAKDSYEFEKEEGYYDIEEIFEKL